MRIIKKLGGQFMDSFLSGFSHNYGNTQVGGTGYAGSVTSTGIIGTNGAQGVDVTQLQPGDTFQGEIVSVNGEDVQIQLDSGQYMAAKLERDVQLALGQVMTLQVQSNKENKIVLKPVYDKGAQMLRVGEAALRAAQMAVNDKNLALVAKLLENGMSIDKKTLMLFNRLSLQNPHVNLDTIIQLNKLQLPVTNNNLTQLQNYQNMEHKLLDGIKEASEEILKLYDNLTGNQGTQENQGLVAGQGQAALENGGKFMEQVLTLLSGEDTQNKSTSETIVSDNNNEQAALNGTIDGKINEEINEQTQIEKNTTSTINPEENAGKNANTTQTKVDSQTAMRDVLNQLSKEKPQVLPNRIIALIKDGRLDIKDMKQLLMDTDLGKMLTTEQKSKIFQSEPFKSMLRGGLQKQWTLTPQELTQEGKVEEFYQKLMKESSQLSRMMNEAMQASGQNVNAGQARAMGNISENVEFMNQMNQMFNYIQLPLKLSNSQAHGDLYVYTNKKNMARKDGMLTAFLHLDMDNLGSLDVSIALQTERNQVTTKFYLDEDSIMLVKEHIEELAQRLVKKGYQCKNLVLEKEEDKTVLEHIQEQVAGTSAMLSYQTFDTRA